MIDASTLQAICAVLDAGGLDATLVSALREQYPGVHFTHCNDDDILDMQPVIERASYNIYLVDGREHCLKMTTDMAAATGLVLADVDADAAAD